MLSTSNIKNVDQAGHYFSQKDNYYTREEGLEQSEWWGNGAEKLNLSGKVNATKFTELLHGKLPNGEQIGKMVENKIQHRPGWDLTLSAPKSISIMALIGGDKRLIEAHRTAANVALSQVERSCSQARVKTSDGMMYQNTGNMVAALYHHDLSRAKDPQLHTHSVVLNMTERLDGKWRSQASQIGRYDQNAKREINGFIERVNYHRRYLSKIYETELAYRVKQLGYEITTDTKSGKFEIVGVSQEAIQFFSKRRIEIEKHLEHQGLSGGAAANVAAMVNRPAKQKVDRVKLKEEWDNHAKRLSLDCKKIIEDSYQKNKEPPTKPINQDTLTAVKAAAKSLSVFQTTFTLEDVVTEAADYAIRHTVNFESLLAAVNAEISSGELISLPNDQGKTVLMSKSTLDDEKKLVTQLSDKKTLQPLVGSFQLMSYLNQHSDIPSAHHEHLKTIFSSDRVVFIEGEAARNALIEPVMNIAHSSNLNVAILSPTLVGSKQLAENLRPEPQTFFEKIKLLFIDNTPKHYSVMQFLSNFDNNQLTPNKQPDVLIVDNAHLLSTHQKANLFEWNRIHHTKLILLGEKYTLLPQQTGTGISDLSEHGIKTLSLQEKNKDWIKDDNQMLHTAIKKMEQRIVEVKQADDRLHAIASHYSRLNENDRRHSWLVAQSKQSVEHLNAMTHQVLKEQQKLGKGIQIKVLVPVFLPEGKSAQAAAYQKDQVVRFNEAYSSLKVERGEYLRVFAVNKNSNRVVLQNDNGKQIIWHPDKIAGKISGKIELFNEKQREFCVGESILFHRSIKAKEVVKGERATITSIHNQTVKLKKDDGKSFSIDLSKSYHSHLDYGYTATPHAIAHERPHTLIAELPAKAFHTDQRRFYQTISQPKEAWIYTDDHKGFVDHLEKKTGDKVSAQETLKRAEDIKQNVHALYDVLEKHIAGQKIGENAHTLSRTAVEAVEYAMHHLAEREAGFTHKELIHIAMEHALGKVNQETLKQAAIAMEKAGILLRGNSGDGTLWTTMDAVKMEREIIALCNQDRGKLQPIVSDELLATYCDPNKLELEQIAAVKAITQSTDRVLAIQGHPGTGKTTMLATVADVLVAKDVLTSQGYEILGLAPTHVAVEELTSRGIPAQTLDSFISGIKNTLQDTELPKRSNLILVIDEASMVSNRKMVEALHIAHQLDCRAIPAGDVRQLPSIEAGKPHDLIQNTQVETKHLTKIRRQENDILKQAVKKTIEYDFKAAFATLKDSITEVALPPRKKDEEKSWEEIKAENREKRVGVLVNDYFSYAKEQRDTIQVITPGHDDRVLTNSLIREKLKEEGTLAKTQDQVFDILTNASMTQVERSHITNLSVGDVLRFGKRESSHIKAGGYLTIMDKNKDHSLIKLRKNDGREIAWQVPTFDKKRLSSIEVFRKEERDLQVGDVIRWSKSDKENALFSSEAATVMAIDKNIMTVTLANKKSFTFDVTNPKFQHWDHGYAATVYAVQGKTKDIVLAHLESFREKLTSQPAFLVALTRSVNEFRLYTDSVTELLKMIEKNKGIKRSSLEVIGEYPAKLAKVNNKEKLKTSLANTIATPDRNQKKEEKNGIKEVHYPLRFTRHTIERIKEGLNREVEKIATDFLGTPKEKGSNYLKFGSNQGSLSITTKGEKQGWFNDFEMNKGGRDMLKFIEMYGGMTRQKALEYGANWLGLVEDKGHATVKLRAASDTKHADVLNKMGEYSFSDYEKKRIKLANQLAGESVAVKGTLAEKYLNEYRGINVETISNDIRFHPKIYCQKNQTALPALLSIARDGNGSIQSVEAIYLNPKTADKADVSLKKQTIGSKKGVAVAIQKSDDPNAPTLIAEGIVTGLSLAQALPNVNVSVTLGKGMFTNIDSHKLSDQVIFCLDNDGKNLKSDKTILAASNRLIASEKEVRFMVPHGLNLSKQDYNDILKEKGCEAIKQDFAHAIPYVDFYDQDKNYPKKMINNQIKLPSQKIIRQVMQREENNPSSLVNRVNEKANSHHISEKLISDFAKDMSKDTHQSDKKYLDSYKTMERDIHQKEMIKQPQLTKDFEREI